MAHKRHCNEFLRTQTGRLAGDGMTHDRYDDESYADEKPWCRERRPIPRKENKEGKEPPIKEYRLSEEELRRYKEGV